MNWPNMVKAGVEYTNPVSSLDIAPTFMALAGGNADSVDFDGVNLMPYVLGKRNTIPHQELKWRFTISAAIRDGDWKLIRLPDRLPLLYHLPTDVSEQNNVALKNLEKTEVLLQKLGEWDVSLPHPVFLEGAIWKRRQLSLYDKSYALTQPALE
jgi:arylsulfatase A-like enzyme